MGLTRLSAKPKGVLQVKNCSPSRDSFYDANKLQDIALIYVDFELVGGFRWRYRLALGGRNGRKLIQLQGLTQGKWRQLRATEHLVSNSLIPLPLEQLTRFQNEKYGTDILLSDLRNRELADEVQKLKPFFESALWEMWMKSQVSRDSFGMEFDELRDACAKLETWRNTV